jgi:hypothetical protein
MAGACLRRFALRGASVASVVATLLAEPGCWPTASSDPGLGARLQIAGAQFVPGATPAVTPGAPGVDALSLETTAIWPGEIGKPLGGAVDPGATAVALALTGDEGYWIVPTGVPDFSAPTLPTFNATASFAPTLVAGPYTLEVSAIDASGRFGAPMTQTLSAQSSSPSAPTPQGLLVVTLRWDTESDLDLHVVDPLGDEIFHGDPQTFEAVGGIEAQLDWDSNANCIIDGRRQEDVVWTGTPPSGTYLVRVDTASLCGQAIANWTVTATLRGTEVALASGVSLDSDTWGPHDRGAGLLAFSFDVP